MYQFNNYQNQLQAMANQIQQMQSNIPQYQQAVSVPQVAGTTINIQTVSGIERATAFSIPPNSSVLLMDNNELKVYFKAADANGMVTLKAYNMVEDTQQQNQPAYNADYATKEDLEAMRKDLIKLIDDQRSTKHEPSEKIYKK